MASHWSRDGVWLNRPALVIPEEWILHYIGTRLYFLLYMRRLDEEGAYQQATVERKNRPTSARHRGRTCGRESVKASSYIEQYPVLRTVQSALHFTILTDLFTQTPSRLLWEASRHMLLLMREGCSYTYPPLPIARNSFIQMSELEQCRVKTPAQSFNTAAQDSNPGSRSRESKALPMMHCALQNMYSTTWWNRWQIKKLKLTSASLQGFRPHWGYGEYHSGKRMETVTHSVVGENTHSGSVSCKQHQKVWQPILYWNNTMCPCNGSILILC